MVSVKESLTYVSISSKVMEQGMGFLTSGSKGKTTLRDNWLTQGYWKTASKTVSMCMY